MNGKPRIALRLFGAAGLVAVMLPTVLLGVATSPASAVIAKNAATVADCTGADTGNIQVTDTDNNSVIGDVSDQWDNGVYVPTTTPSDYLSVTLTAGSEVNITANNEPDATYPLIGGVDGNGNTSPLTDLSEGSYNYLYLGGVTASAAGATPQTGTSAFSAVTGQSLDFESAIWTVGADNELVPQWINSDGSTPPTHLVLLQNAFYMTGDVSQFETEFGPGADVALTFVPTTGCATSLSVAASPSSATYGTTITFKGTLSGGSTATSPVGSISMDAWPKPNCNGATPATIGDPSFSVGNVSVNGTGIYTIGTEAPPVGTYHLNDYFADSDGANVSSGSGCDAGTLTITPAHLTITGSVLTLPYGSSIPTLTPTYKGFVLGDTSASLSAQPTCTTTATSHSATGTYPVKCSGAADPNYTITYVAGSITIVPATVSFKITGVFTTSQSDTTALLGEVGLPANAEGIVYFVGPSASCMIDLTGKPGEATTCSADFGPNVPYAITGYFSDTDGDYTSSHSTNELEPHGQ